MTLRVVTIWRRELVNFNKTRDNHLARFGHHFDHTLIVRSDKTIGPHISLYGTQVHKISSGKFGLIAFWIKVLLWLRTNTANNKIDAIVFPIGEEPMILPTRLLFLMRDQTPPSLILDLWDVPGLALEGSDRTIIKSTIRKAYLWLLPKLIKRANFVISGVVRQPFLNMGVHPDKLINTENGVNIDQFEGSTPNADLWSGLPERTDRTVRLLYQGYIHAARGSVAMVQMVSDLRELGHNVQLLLVGPSEPKQLEILRTESMQKGISTQVAILDNVDSTKIPAVIAEADICLCPLADIEKFRWSYPVKIYEYMAMGKPVVASKLPGIEKMIKSKSIGGCLFDPADFNKMTEATVWLIENPEQRQHIAKQGFEHAKTKSWETIVNKLATAINSKVLNSVPN